MVAYLWCLVLTYGAPGARLSYSGFGMMCEYMTATRQMRQSGARPAAFLEPHLTGIRACFHASAVPHEMLSVRLGLWDGREWLFVDERGLASYGNRWGYFDVVSWEKIVRRLPASARVARSSLVNLTVKNETAQTILIETAFGLLVASAPPKSKIRRQTWLCDHVFLMGDMQIGSVDRSWYWLTNRSPKGLKIVFSPELSLKRPPRARSYTLAFYGR